MTAPISDVDFYSDATVADPVAAYHRMLRLGPIVWLEAQQIHAICGFEAVTSALRKADVFRSGHGVSINEDVNPLLVGSTLNSDRPAHDETRAITFAPLTPKALQTVRERIVSEAEFIADRVVGMGRFDAAADLAPHLPLTIVRDLVGLGDGGKDHMLGWGAATFELMGDSRDRKGAAFDKIRAMRRFLEDEATVEALTPDGWARRATQAGLAKGMEPGPAAELMRDYIAPSLDTTISAIGYGVHLFARNPEQWDKLRADRSLIRNAIEEIVRLNTPIRAFTRYLAEDTEVAGVVLTKGSRALLVYGAANRDATRFADPDTFDVDRETRGHLGFGHGVHTCLGMHLARLEMTCLFEALLDRVARFEVAGPVVPAVNATIHAFASVPLRVAHQS